MNPLKIILPLAVVGASFAVWHYSPAFRTKARDVLEDYGAWTEEARADDPVGYIKFAIRKLEADVGKFDGARGNLAAAKQEAEAKRVEYTQRHVYAVELSEKMKQAFQTAEGGAGYPLAFQVGASSEDYTREQFLAQVSMTLAERDASDQAVDQFTTIIATIDASATGVTTRTTQVRINITQLKTQLAVVEVQQLTSEIEELMTNVQHLIGENETAIQALPEDGDPVRSLDQFLEAMQAEEAGIEAEEAEPADAAALQFLQG